MNPSQALPAYKSRGSSASHVHEEMKAAKPLPAVLNTLDLIAFFFLTLVFAANTTSVQFGGSPTFLYWIAGGLSLLLPNIYIAQWLTRRFPGASGPYLWAKHILGSHWAFLSGFCLWIPSVLSITSICQVCLIFLQYFQPSWFLTAQTQGIGIALVLFLATCITLLPLRWLKWGLVLLTLLYLSVFLCLGLAGLWHLLSGSAPARPLDPGHILQFSPQHNAVYSLVVLALLGADYPLILGNELRKGKLGQKKTMSFLWWGGGLAILAYLSGTFGVMVIISPDSAGKIESSIWAIILGFGKKVATLMAVILALSQLAMVVAFLLMGSRMIFVVAADRLLPQPLTKTSSAGVPFLCLVVQSVLVALVALLSFVAIPLILQAHRPSVLAFEIYHVLLASSALLWMLSTLETFLLPFWLLTRRHWRDILRQMQQPPVSAREYLLLLVAAVVGGSAALTGIWQTLTASWLPPLIPLQRWTILIVGVALLTLVVGLLASELPRVSTLLKELRLAHQREGDLLVHLQAAYQRQRQLTRQQHLFLQELTRLYQEQAQVAFTDAVTGLPNHQAIIATLDETITRCQVEHTSCTLLFLDLDHFKGVNDQWGHQAGDAVLRECALRLRKSWPLEKSVGRYGGEEFALIVPDCDQANALRIAEHLCQAIAENPYSWQSETSSKLVTIAVTASIGIALYPDHATTRDTLIEQADRAMYRAKHAGRNQVGVILAKSSGS